MEGIMKDQEFSEETFIERKILDMLFDDWRNYGHKEEYEGFHCIRLVGKAGDLETVVRCLKLLINLELVEGSGRSDYQGIPWQFVKLSPSGIFLCHKPDKLNEDFPRKPTGQNKGQIGFTGN